MDTNFINSYMVKNPYQSPFLGYFPPSFMAPHTFGALSPLAQGIHSFPISTSSQIPKSQVAYEHIKNDDDDQNHSDDNEDEKPSKKQRNNYPSINPDVVSSSSSIPSILFHHQQQQFCFPSHLAFHNPTATTSTNGATTATAAATLQYLANNSSDPSKSISITTFPYPSPVATAPQFPPPFAPYPNHIPSYFGIKGNIHNPNSTNSNNNSSSNQKPNGNSTIEVHRVDGSRIYGATSKASKSHKESSKYEAMESKTVRASCVSCIKDKVKCIPIESPTSNDKSSSDSSDNNNNNNTNNNDNDIKETKVIDINPINDNECKEVVKKEEESDSVSPRDDDNSNHATSSTTTIPQPIQKDTNGNITSGNDKNVPDNRAALQNIPCQRCLARNRCCVRIMEKKRGRRSKR